MFWFKLTWNQTRDSAGSNVVTRKDIKKQGNDCIFLRTTFGLKLENCRESKHDI